MKKFLLTFLFAMLASPAWATTYFLAPASGGGNDANNGTSTNTPWLSLNHAVNCGDTIIAAAGNYSSSNFGSNRWGTVSCPGNNNVAWLKCATFDACRIDASSAYGMWISASFWGVQGWEVHAIGSYAGCWVIAPANSGASSIHHVVVANDIANGCTASGIATVPEGTAGVDYVAVVGNIVYDASSDSTACYSGISILQPVQFDTAPGTHIYVAGNFSYGNLDPNPCAGGAPTDGEGIIFDTIDTFAYAQQMVIYNNIVLGNGGRGIQTLKNSTGSNHAPIFIYNNTAWGNDTDPHQGFPPCGEIELATTVNSQVYRNIAMTNSASCYGGTHYSYFITNGDATDQMYQDVGYSATGTDIGVQSSGSFASGSNLFGTDPSFASPSIPGPPSCGSATSVPNCMATVIADFTPRLTVAKPYGYQVPLTTKVLDPLFPAWLCNVGLPPGLVTMGCASSSSLPAPPTITNVIVH